MKKIVFIVLFLSGCASFYGLSEDEYKLRRSQYSEILKYTSSMTFDWYLEHVDKPYSDYLAEQTCSLEFSYRNVSDWGEKRENCIQSKKKLVYTHANLLELAQKGNRYYGVYDLDEMMLAKTREIERNRINKEWENRVAKRQKKMAAAEKKYGKKFCSEPALNVYILRNEAIPSNCLVYSDELVFRTSQQITDGTLVSVAYPQYSRNLLIIKNNKDSSLISGQNVPAGLFIGQGNYTYTTVLGAPITVSKLKRLD